MVISAATLITCAWGSRKTATAGLGWGLSLRIPGMLVLLIWGHTHRAELWGEYQGAGRRGWREVCFQTVSLHTDQYPKTEERVLT